MDANTKDVMMIAVPLVGTLVTSAVSAYVAIKMAELKTKLGDVAVAVNGRMTDLIDSAKVIGGYEAVVKGKEPAKTPKGTGKVTK